MKIIDWLLGKLSRRSEVDRLIEALKGSNITAQTNAATALETIGNPAVVPRVLFLATFLFLWAVASAASGQVPVSADAVQTKQQSELQALRQKAEQGDAEAQIVNMVNNTIRIWAIGMSLLRVSIDLIPIFHIPLNYFRLIYIFNTSHSYVNGFF